MEDSNQFLNEQIFRSLAKQSTEPQQIQSQTENIFSNTNQISQSIKNPQERKDPENFSKEYLSAVKKLKFITSINDKQHSSPSLKNNELLKDLHQPQKQLQENRKQSNINILIQEKRKPSVYSLQNNYFEKQSPKVESINPSKKDLFAKLSTIKNLPLKLNSSSEAVKQYFNNKNLLKGNSLKNNEKSQSKMADYSEGHIIRHPVKYLSSTKLLNPIKMVDNQPMHFDSLVHQKLHESKISKKLISQFKNEQIERDILKHPYKYKILCDELGQSFEEVYNINPQRLNEILDKFGKAKGDQYLRKNNQHSKSLGKYQQVHPIQFQPYALSPVRPKQSNTKPSAAKNKPIPQKLQPNKQQNFDTKQLLERKEYVHNIFKNLKKKEEKVEKVKKVEESDEKQSQNRIRVANLANKEQKLGKIIFEKVKKHLIEGDHLSYSKRVHSEQRIDDALILILKTKIKRANQCIKNMEG